MIDAYPVLSIPLALLINRLGKRGKLISRGVVFVLFTLILHNIFQLEQYKYNTIHYDSMTREAYKKVFLKLHPPEGHWDLLKSPDYEKAVKGIREYP